MAGGAGAGSRGGPGAVGLRTQGGPGAAATTRCRRELTVDSFVVRDGELWAEDVPLRRIAAAVGTPFYCYATTALERNYRAFADAFAAVDATVCFALKANSNVAVVRTLARLGAGADIVSEGELRRALAAGIPGHRIVFSGVGKTRAEMAGALDAGILQFNVESEAELEALSETAASRGVRAPVAVRLNPDVDAASHDKISTGRRGDKFGLDWPAARRAYRRAASLSGVEVVGAAIHIGSQVGTLAPFARAFRFLAEAAGALRAEGHALRRLDLGGGLAVPYESEALPTVAEYAGTALREMVPAGLPLLLEPGRAIAGDAGILVVQVLYEKDAGGRRAVIVDGAMNDLLRPALYGARHRVEPVRPAARATVAPADVVGPVCESSDCLARDVALPILAPGDLLAVRTAGAYGAVMASTYNSRPLVPEVLARGREFATVRPRPTHEQLIAADATPPWLA